MLSGEDGPEALFWSLDHREKEALSYPIFSFKELNWAVMIFLNQRGIGWNHQVKNVPESKPQKKSKFLKERIGQFMINFLLTDLLFQLGIHLFYTNHANGIVGDVDAKYISLDYRDYRWNHFATFVFGATP